VKLCRIAVFARPGYPIPAADVQNAQAPGQDVSSTEVRARLARGDDVASLVPAPVLAYIRARGLYQ
jgi:nicotinate-nucleotide adenylyltransferase